MLRHFKNKYGLEIQKYIPMLCHRVIHNNKVFYADFAFRNTTKKTYKRKKTIDKQFKALLST